MGSTSGLVIEAPVVIKAVWAGRPEYRRSVTSYDIYEAVLREAVSTPDEFDNWVSNRRPTPG